MLRTLQVTNSWYPEKCPIREFKVKSSRLHVDLNFTQLSANHVYGFAVRRQLAVVFASPD